LGKEALIASSNPFNPSTEQIRRSFTPRFLSSVRTPIQNLDDCQVAGGRCRPQAL
jgi:hypothetical protein